MHRSRTSAAARTRDGPGGATPEGAMPGGATPGGAMSGGARTKRHLEGPLQKYTNLLRGWQSRFFVLDADSVQLWYYLSSASRGQQPPRGSVCVEGARVCPCADHPFMFTLQSRAGEVYKLRARDAEEQELWMTQLQLCSTSKVLSPGEAQKNQTPDPETRRGPLCEDQDLLMFKAPPSLSCLGRCLSLFHLRLQSPGPEPQSAPERGPAPGRAPRRSPLHRGVPGVLGPANHSSPPHKPGSAPNSHQNQTCTEGPGGSRSLPQVQQSESTVPPVSGCRSAPPAAHSSGGGEESEEEEEEEEDTEDNEEEELGVLDEQRNIITHLLSQLKLGMDLTRVVLPTFILEKRSLLEMYADFLSHPDLFLSISCGRSPEERMVRLLEYYLTSFHEGRRGAVAKKPYNPILGETFHCSWRVPRDRVRPQSRGAAGGDCYTVRFVAEQVSHHPPVSGFYCECPERRMCVNAHVCTRSKFMGVSVGVSMVGEGVLYLLEHGERYVFTLPCAYARSVLTVPWVELGGKVSISCVQTGLSSSVTFHTKPFYGGKVHRVTAEVRNDHTGALVCRAQGEWNGVLEFTYSGGETRAIDTHGLPVTRKRIRAVHKQSPLESRRLWQHVTEALKTGNMEEATEHKRHLEEKQRNDERQRTASRTQWTPKYFLKQGEGWIYHRPLWETH